MTKLRFPRTFPDSVDHVRHELLLECLLIETVQILNNFRDWSKPIENLHRALGSTTQRSSKKSKGKKAILDTSVAEMEIVLPDNPSPAAISTYNDINTLLRAFRHATSANLNTILTHMELMTSAISWFAQVSSHTDCAPGDAH
jgi:hypothetical protein